MPFVDASDGTRLYYQDWGTGKPVVLVSAAFMNSEMWELQMTYLASSGLRCIAYDRRGHGRSDWPGEGYDYETLASDLAALIESLNLQDITLVGYSMGSGEVVRYLSRYGSERVARIAILAGTAPFLRKTEDNPDGIEQRAFDSMVAKRTQDRPKWFADNAPPFFGAGLPGNSVSSERVQWGTQMCLQCSPKATIDCSDSFFHTDFRAEMSDIRIPTLIIHGDSDQSAPIHLCGQKSAKLVQGSKFIVYENAAHGFFITHADRLNADLLEFVNT
ncbi:alpha/beta fold hydrolase [Brevibacillus choshinensis]|uniref:Alpha/beta hydrolase n=1 Tax=Brevibacillus choshinensis TaxID=54911 RepID=A0ABX7FGQ6_BRECH|nr:alpha/beta hydrolase [Brevibacillus choshinensis]QRG65327.1 alpha/beta hydrolase [Brevibacillus choshinensis]